MKNIILLSDGTGNSAAKRHGTNVWKLYQALDIHRSDQIAYYDDGVGTEEFLPFKLLGGAFGLGLKNNVIELYKFLCRNYRMNDKIYLFGFSRGAYTVRLLTGMIDYCGLYVEHKNEDDLNDRAKNNYYHLRTYFKQTKLSKLYCESRKIKKLSDGTVYPEIKFIGVWDTVDAYGFPIEEMTTFWDRFIFPLRFPNRELSVKVKKACHALSVDDERHTFHPVLWDENKEEELIKQKKIQRNRLEQVWFSGAHSDIGGGYPKNNLAMITLNWMISKVEVTQINKSGLHFISQIRNEIFSHSDWHGVQHDSRSGLGSYYRYNPRIIGELCNDKKNNVYINHPKIHCSVLERIKDNIVMYAPLGLPTTYKVVETLDDTFFYEDQEAAEKRKQKLIDALEVVKQRKYLYFALVFTTIILFASRFFLEWIPDHQYEGVIYIFNPILNLFIMILPDFLAPWFEVLKQHPIWLWGFVVVFATLFRIKKNLWENTQIKAMHAWESLKKQ